MERTDSVKSFAVTVGDTATIVVPTDNDTRTVYLHNESGGSMYLGGSDVSTTNGYHLKNNETMSIVVPGGSNLRAIIASGTATLIVLRPSDA